MCKPFIGPMAVDEFFRTFLPCTPTEFSKADKNGWAGFEGVSAAGLEKQMYGEFVRPHHTSFFRASLTTFRADLHRQFTLYKLQGFQHLGQFW
jgi:hypothetical protein